MSALFDKIWLRTDTHIDNLSPGQRRTLRHLCERFFEKGRQFPINHRSGEANPWRGRGDKPESGTIVPEMSTTNEQDRI